MSHKISLSAFGNATIPFNAISFSLGVGFNLIFPEHAMYEGWLKLLPGFQWISWERFLLDWLKVMPMVGLSH